MDKLRMQIAGRVGIRNGRCVRTLKTSAAMTGFSFLMRKRRCSASIRRDGRACWWHGSYTSMPRHIVLPRDHELDEALIE
jgi:hypothetical protein